jgi:hypothetical protein
MYLTSIHHSSVGFIQGQVMWDLWRIKWHCLDRFHLSILVSFANSQSINAPQSCNIWGWYKSSITVHKLCMAVHVATVGGLCISAMKNSKPTPPIQKTSATTDGQFRGTGTLLKPFAVEHGASLRLCWSESNCQHDRNSNKAKFYKYDLRVLCEQVQYEYHL